MKSGAHHSRGRACKRRSGSSHCLQTCPISGFHSDSVTVCDPVSQPVHSATSPSSEFSLLELVRIGLLLIIKEP